MGGFYFLICKKEPGCPEGDRGFILLKDLNKESREHYGLSPWYAGPKRYGGELQPFPQGLVLMTNNQRSRYDLVRGSNYFYIISKKVRDVLSRFNTSFVDIVPVRYVNMSQKDVVDREYFVGATRRIAMKDVCNLSLTKCGGKYGASVLSISFNDDLDLDLFDLYDTSGVEFSLVASERLMLALVAAGIKGVEFCPVEGFKLKTSDECKVLKQRYFPV